MNFKLFLVLSLLNIQLYSQIATNETLIDEKKHSEYYFTNLKSAKDEFQKVKTLNLNKTDVLAFAYPNDTFPNLENLILQNAMSVFSSFLMYPKIKNICLINLNYKDHTSLPNDFNKYSKLEKLALFQTNTDSIPSSLFESKTIKMICLNGKEIKALPIINGLDSLKYLYFDNTSIDTLNNQFLKLKSLETVTFRNSNFRFIPKVILQMENLVSIDFSANPISVLPDSIGNMKNLKAIKLTGLKLKYLPKSLKYSNVTYVMLDDNKYSSKEKAKIKKGLPKNCIIFWNSNLDYVIDENCACTKEIEF